jgi:hypothetical protein
MVRSIVFAATVLCFVARADAATRLAVLEVESPTLANVATFLELELLKLRDTEALDRATIDAVLKEQTLERAFSAGATADRVALGTILKADVLVLLQTIEQPKRHANVVVFETKRGLRLQVQPFEITANAQNDAKTILPNVTLALERARGEVREIVAVPPMVSTNLSLERQASGKSLSTVVEQMLLTRPGFAVVELAEAKALADEAALTASKGVDRKLPLYLLGEFRHDGFGADAAVTITLSLKRGTTVIGSHTIKDAAPRDVASLLRTEAAALFDTASNTTTPPADATVEAKQLAERAKLMYRLSAWLECVELAEASLLLKPDQLDLHRLIVDAVNEKIRLDYRRGYDKASDAKAGRGMERYTMKQEPIDESTRREHVALLHRALPHLEYFMSRSNLKYSADLYGTIGGFFGLCKGLHDEPPAMFVRVMKAKKAAKRNDDTIAFWEYCAQSCFEENSSEKKWQWKLAMAENWPVTDEKNVRAKRGSASRLTGLIIHRIDRDDPFLPTALERLKAIDNPDVQQVASDIARRLEQGLNLFADIPLADAKRPAAPTTPPKPPDSNEDADIQFTMEGYIGLELAEGLAGWMPAGPGIDAAWTDDWLFFFKDKVPPQRKDLVRIKHSVLGRCVCYDGRSVWAYRTTAEGKSELIVVDPKSAHVEAITPEHGLPPMPLTTASITALREGSACVVGHFDGRAWIGLASFDPTSGKRSFRVIHEALEQTVGKQGSAWRSPKTAFEWSKVYTLSGPPAADGTVPQRIVVERAAEGADHPLLIDPATDAVEVLEASTGWISGEAVQHEGAMYWAGKAPKGWRIHRLGFPSLKPEPYSHPIPERTRLFHAGSLIGLQSIHPMVTPDTVWLADGFGEAFRPFRTARYKGTEMNSVKYFSSSAFGLVALRGQAWFSVHVKRPAKGDSAR